MTDESLPTRRYSWRVPITTTKGEPTREHYQFIAQLQHWVPQTAVLDAGVQAQLSDVRYSVEAAQSSSEQVRAEVSALKGDPRLEAGPRAEQLALAALVRTMEAGDKEAAKDALKLAEAALIHSLARQDAKFSQEIGEVHAALAGLEQQMATLRANAERFQQHQNEAALLAFPLTETTRAATTSRVSDIEQRLDNLTTDEVDEGAVNLYYTDARARAALSGTAPVSYNSGTGAIALNASLTSLGGLSAVADRFAYATGADTWALATVTAFGRSLVDDVDASAARTTLALGTIATQNANAIAVTGGTAFGLSGVQITSNSITGSGSGLELSGGASGLIQAYNRTGGAYIQLTFDGSQINFRTSGSNRFVVSSTGANVASGTLSMAGTQIATTRRTGWSAATGTATRTTFDTATVTLPLLAERVKALLDDLTTHGLIGA